METVLWGRLVIDCPVELRYMRGLITGIVLTVPFSQDSVCEIYQVTCLHFLCTALTSSVILTELQSHSLVHHNYKGIIWITSHTSNCTCGLFLMLSPALQYWLQQVLTLQTAEMTYLALAISSAMDSSFPFLRFTELDGKIKSLVRVLAKLSLRS